MAKKQPDGLETLLQIPRFKANVAVPELNFNGVVSGFLPDQRAQGAHKNENDRGSDHHDRAWFLIFHDLLHDFRPSVNAA